MFPFLVGAKRTVLMARSGTALLLEIRRRVDADRLSGRQRDIALLYAAGHSGPQIAARLGLSPSTVNNHLGVVFKKLAVKNKLQLLDAMRCAATGTACRQRPIDLRLRHVAPRVEHRPVCCPGDIEPVALEKTALV